MPPLDKRIYALPKPGKAPDQGINRGGQEASLYEKIRQSPIKKMFPEGFSKPSNGEPRPGSTIFKKQEGPSRLELREILKDAYDKQAGTGLKMDAIQRAKLEKKVFPSHYGANISKSDFKSGVTKLNRRIISEKDPEKKSEMRKEVKFLKRLGKV